jgi:hypothetical protein
MQTKESKQLKQVSAEDLQLNTFEGFNRRFDAYLKVSRTQNEAYDRAEADHSALFGVDKYSGYESFRQCRNRKFKINR